MQNLAGMSRMPHLSLILVVDQLFKNTKNHMN